MARQDGVDDLRHDGVFVADDAGKERFPALQFADQVLAKFVFDAAADQSGFGEGTGSEARRGYGVNPE